MKHPAIIAQIIEELIASQHEAWMDGDDKAQFRSMCLDHFASNGTLEEFDEAIEAGIQKGTDPEQQLALFRGLLNSPHDFLAAVNSGKSGMLAEFLRAHSQPTDQ